MGKHTQKSHGYVVLCITMVLIHPINDDSLLYFTGCNSLPPPESTAVPEVKEADYICSQYNNSAVIAVLAVSLLLIVTLITVILTQCLLILRMRRSVKRSADVPVSHNEAYDVHKISNLPEDGIYAVVN